MVKINLKYPFKFSANKFNLFNFGIEFFLLVLNLIKKKTKIKNLYSILKNSKSQCFSKRKEASKLAAILGIYKPLNYNCFKNV